MSNNPLRARQVQGPLKEEFNARKDGGKLLQWTAKRFPWIYVLSCSSACSSQYDELGNDPDTAGKSVSLFGSNIAFAAYDKVTKLSHPIVTGLDVTAMGSLGTTRKAVIKITCFSDDQLVELQKCYFIPGMDVRVQWGWSVSCDGTTPPSVLKQKNTPPTEVVCQINKRRKANSNYDGFQGIIANFKYSLTKDNTWDCEMEVISPADPFTESNAGSTSSPCPRKAETDQGETIESFGPVYAALSDLYKEGLKAKNRISLKISEGTKDTTHHYFSSWNYEGVERTETGSDRDGGWFSGWFAGEETTECWMSFGAFVDLINVMSIPNNGKGEYPLGRIDINDVTLNAPKEYIMSADPRVCYIPGGKLKVQRFANLNIYGGEGPSAIITEDGQQKVVLAKIMCNTIFLLKHYKQVYDGDGKIKTLLDNILGEINRTCGRPWTFITISTEDDCDAGAENKTGPTITILDEKQAIDLGSESYEIPSTVGDSTLRSFSLDMKMTGAMKTQAVYAGNSQKSKGGNGDDSTACAGASVRAFYVGGDIKNLAKPKPETLGTSDGGCEDSDNVAEEPTFDELVDKFWWEVNDQSVGALQTFLEKEISVFNPRQCAGQMLPFDFNFTVDGVSGFEFGQIVTSNRIPKAVRDNKLWQVTKVEHSITPNDWETSISTVCKPSFKPNDGGQAKS